MTLDGPLPTPPSPPARWGRTALVGAAAAPAASPRRLGPQGPHHSTSWETTCCCTEATTRIFSPSTPSCAAVSCT